MSQAIWTSETHPIRVDWLPVGGPGRVGMTFAPGKCASSKYQPGTWKRDLAADLDRLVRVERADVLVCLVQDFELRDLGISTLKEDAEKRGLTVVHLPIPDQGVLPDPQPVRKLVGDIDAMVAAGKRVVIHCVGGLGRTGTVAGCWLVQRGLAPDAAIAQLHETRKSPHCPENSKQERFIAASIAWRSVGSHLGLEA